MLFKDDPSSKIEYKMEIITWMDFQSSPRCSLVFSTPPLVGVVPRVQPPVRPRRLLGLISPTLILEQIPKAEKDTNDLTVFFALLGSGGVKAARKTLMKLTPGG